MGMFESIHVLNSVDTRSAWGSYEQFWKNLMLDYVAKAKQNVIMLGHTVDIVNNSNGEVETIVPIKGALKNVGLESFFSTIVAAKKVTTLELEDYSNNFLNLTPRDKKLKYKYVYQTLLTEKTVHERIRQPWGMWEDSETYIDNNVQTVLDRFHTYYS